MVNWWPIWSMCNPFWALCFDVKSHELTADLEEKNSCRNRGPFSVVLASSCRMGFCPLFILSISWPSGSIYLFFLIELGDQIFKNPPFSIPLSLSPSLIVSLISFLPLFISFLFWSFIFHLVSHFSFSLLYFFLILFLSHSLTKCPTKPVPKQNCKLLNRIWKSEKSLWRLTVWIFHPAQIQNNNNNKKSIKLQTPLCLLTAARWLSCFCFQLSLIPGTQITSVHRGLNARGEVRHLKAFTLGRASHIPICKEVHLLEGCQSHWLTRQTALKGCQSSPMKADKKKKKNFYLMNCQYCLKSIKKNFF